MAGRIVLIGAAGQLAHDLTHSLAGRDLVTLTRQEIDLTNPAKLSKTLADIGPGTVINAAAYNLVDQAESEPAAAFAVNAIGATELAKCCERLGAVLMHFSSDYVYGLDAEHESAWKETDVPGPVSVYGNSKLAGEYGVRANCRKYFVVRTCGLYGVKGSRGKGGNFVETMLRLGASGKTLRVVNDQTCTPSYTADVARAAISLLDTDAYGLYHITNQGGCTWFEFAGEIFHQVGMSVDCRPITAAEYAAAARRPTYSVLDNDKLASIGVNPCPPWQDALARYLAARPTPAGPAAQ